MRRVHREETERVGANRLGRNSRWKRGLAYRTTEETALCSTGHVRNGILFIERGSGVPQKEETDLCSTSYDRNRVLLIGRGVAYRKTEETDLCWSATVETGVLFIRRGVAYRKTGLHGILFISTIDLLQPPRATVHPPSTSSSLHLRLFIHGLLLIQPAPRAPPLATIQPALSTGSCSTTPPRATVHPALHRLLFIQPSTGSSYSSSPPRGPVHPPLHRLDRSGPCSSRAMASTTTGSCSSNPPATLIVHPNPPTTLTFHPEAASIGFS